MCCLFPEKMFYVDLIDPEDDVHNEINKSISEIHKSAQSLSKNTKSLSEDLQHLNDFLVAGEKSPEPMDCTKSYFRPEIDCFTPTEKRLELQSER